MSQRRTAIGTASCNSEARRSGDAARTVIEKGKGMIYERDPRKEARRLTSHPAQQKRRQTGLQVY